MRVAAADPRVIYCHQVALEQVHPEWVLQRIPPRHLHHQRGVKGRRARLGDLGPLRDRVGRAIFAEERRRTRWTMVQQTRGPDDRLHVFGVELDVLAGCLVDAGGMT